MPKPHTVPKHVNEHKLRRGMAGRITIGWIRNRRDQNRYTAAMIPASSTATLMPNQKPRRFSMISRACGP